MRSKRFTHKVQTRLEQQDYDTLNAVLERSSVDDNMAELVRSVLVAFCARYRKERTEQAKRQYKDVWQ